LERVQQKVLVLDGAMGTRIQALGLTPDDFAGVEGCNELLVETRPDAIRAIHASYLEVGCDAIETDSFGSNEVVLAEYGLAGRAHGLSLAAARLARGVADDFSSPDRPRYVVGSVGPGTRLPSLGQIGFDVLREAFLPQFQGLLEGGVDALCIETCQDLLQIKAAVIAAREAMARAGRQVALLVSVTLEANGSMLLGTDLGAAAAAILPLGVDALGLNCATGPAEMKRHAVELSRLGPQRLLAMPNAGLPLNLDGRLVYPLSPAEFATWVEGLVREDGFGLVGGCCGTTQEHLAELVRRVGDLPAPRREVRRAPALASLYQAVGLRQEPAPLLIGERTNANGSKEFRERLLADDLDGMLGVAREQERAGAHVLDLCVAYTGRDEARDLAAVVPRLATEVRLPLLIDTTDPAALEAALSRYGGRAVVNSVNLEEGVDRLDRVAGLARRFGAALVALAIDEQGMALTAARKLEVAERLLERCVARHGLEPCDLLFDLLTFTVGSGDEGSRHAAVETLEAIRQWKHRHPDTHTLLGVSNVSFGLKPAARRVLNSVFLHLALEAGLDAAIVNARGITPLHRIPEPMREAARRLLLDDRSQGDPLAAFLELAARDSGEPADDAQVDRATLPPVQRLRALVLEGERGGLTATLDALLDACQAPLELINQVLVPAMREVGERFAAGDTQLPFVLQSAEVMRAAVRHLEPRMDASQREERGCLVLATVRGDVHDIGKNLVQILVGNNGFQVVDLGVKVPVEAMVQAVRRHQPMALGMSGLLVRSTWVMRENLEELRRQGISVPVLVGGAALTRAWAENELAAAYGGPVIYCPTAMDGLQAVQQLAADRHPGGSRDPGWTVDWTPASAGVTDAVTGPIGPPGGGTGLEDLPPARVSHQTPSRERRGREGLRPRTASTPQSYLWYGEDARSEHDRKAPEDRRSQQEDGEERGLAPIPTPPFWGTRVLDPLPLEEVFAHLHERFLIRGQWQYRQRRMSNAEYQALLDGTVKPELEAMKREALERGLVTLRAVYGYLPCVARGEEVLVLDPQGTAQLARFHFPRAAVAPVQQGQGASPPTPPPPCTVGLGGDVAPHSPTLARGLSLADFLAPAGAGQRDVLPLFVVGVGGAMAAHLEGLRAADRYRDYFLWHGLSTDLADAAADWLHARVRAELGIGPRGERYSFGYPACPGLEGQRELFRLLAPERVGVSLTEEMQMVPEQAVSAFVLHHPDAHYW
jgi:5-methyltetrahydrofolate--homocysteine methyltransferase